MDFWHKARSFAEEAAKRSQELTREAAKRSQELTIGNSKLSDIVSETAKRSKEIAAEASKRADQIKLLAEGIGARASLESTAGNQEEKEKDLERFGVTDDLREFVKGITMRTFQDFPLEDDSEMNDIPTVSNVRQDLTEWQEKHASLVLSTVKEISKLRYELCPRIMKERKFWRIYFVLVNSHVAPYEKRYMEDAKMKSAEQVKDDGLKEAPKVGIIEKAEEKGSNQQSKTSASSSTEQDLDAFLLGDPGDSDEGPDDDDGDFDDDFDKLGDSSDDEKRKE